MEVTGYKDGVFCWVEVTSTQIEHTEKFYGDLFGWDLKKNAKGFEGSYRFEKEGKVVAGVVYGRELQQNSWLAYVSVSDVYKTMSVVKASGGSGLLDPIEVPGYGRVAMFSDPTGALFAVWQAKERHGLDIKNESNSFVWAELITDDADKAFSFYSDIFGWAKSDPDEFDAIELKLGDGSVGGIVGVAGNVVADFRPYWAVHFGVDNIETAIETVHSNNGKLLMPMKETSYGRFATVVDSLGSVFSLVETEL